MKNKPKLPHTALVIFGAAGDLTWRKLVPALYDLFIDELLPERFAIFGVDGKSISVEDWRSRLHAGVTSFPGTVRLILPTGRSSLAIL